MISDLMLIEMSKLDLKGAIQSALLE